MGLKVQNVSKTFGEKLAVDNISFEINKPGVFDYLEQMVQENLQQSE